MTGDKVRILFVGNSFTRIGNVPGLVVRLLESSSSVRYEAETSLSDGKNFRWHWHRGEAAKQITEGRFDIVVLQGSSLSVYGGAAAEKGYTPEAMETYAGKFVDLARSHGARPILYATQAASGKAEHFAAVTEKYIELAQRFDVPVALCGAAWQRAHCVAPRLRLDVGDEYCHQNRDGVYLAGCVFYTLFTGESPEGGWHRAQKPPPNPGPTPRPALPRDESTARQIEEIAWETVEEYSARGDIRTSLLQR